MRVVYIIVLYILSSAIAEAQFKFQFDNTIPVKHSPNNNYLSDPWAGGINAGQFSTIDLNGDKLEDLIIYDRTSNLLNTFIYNNGQYSYNPDYRELFPPDIEGWILLEDYNCDGLKDIFTDSQKGMRVFRNVGSVDQPEFVLEADPVLSLGYSGYINLVVNITDVPAIDDVDGDGDLDVLVYNFALGGYIRYHRNMSVERTGNCGSLDYVLETRDWGSFEECDCHLYAFNAFGETCANINPGRKMHSGGKSILLIDMDGDGDMDFLGGHEQCDELYFLENVGTPEQALMTAWREDFPTIDHPANMTIFPAAYWEDMDKDGLKDLIVSPNDLYNPFKNIDYGNSSWYYKNKGSNQIPDFEFVSDVFLQDQMLDFGENAAPAFIDYNGDGLLDLMVGRNGLKVDDTYFGSIVKLTNTGDASLPEFTIMDEDYLNLSSLHAYDLLPRFADLNGDNSSELIIYYEIPNSFESRMRIFWNKASEGQGLSIDKEDYMDIDINLGIDGAPFFVDVDQDGLIDMLAGRATGRLEYYRNVGNETYPMFVIEENEFLGIADSYIEFRRNLVPWVADLDLDNKDDLITADYIGSLRIYPDFRNYNQEEDLPVSMINNNQVLDSIKEFDVGYHSFPAVAILSTGKPPAMVIGNPQGGLSMYKNITEIKNGLNEFILTIYPNPLTETNQLCVRLNEEGYIIIYNAIGQQLENPVIIPENAQNSTVIEYPSQGVSYIPGKTTTVLEIGYLPQGLYIVKAFNRSGQTDSQSLVVIR